MPRLTDEECPKCEHTAHAGDCLARVTKMSGEIACPDCGPSDDDAEAEYVTDAARRGIMTEREYLRVSLEDAVYGFLAGIVLAAVLAVAQWAAGS